MRQNLLEGVTLTDVHHQHLPQKIFGSSIGERLGKVEVCLRYLLIGLLDAGSLEGGAADEHQVHYYSSTPNVHLVRMARYSYAQGGENDFGSDIVGRAANSVLSIPGKLQFSGETEVCQFQLHFIVDEQISQFDATSLQRYSRCMTCLLCR